MLSALPPCWFAQEFEHSNAANWLVSILAPVVTVAANAR